MVEKPGRLNSGKGLSKKSEHWNSQEGMHRVVKITTQSDVILLCKGDDQTKYNRIKTISETFFQTKTGNLCSGMNH